MSRIKILYNQFQKVEYFLKKTVLDQQKWNKLINWYQNIHLPWARKYENISFVIDLTQLFYEIKEANFKNLTKRELEIYKNLLERKQIVEMENKKPKQVNLKKQLKLF